MLENKPIAIKVTITKLLMFLSMFGVIIAASFFVGSRYATRNMQILYISQDELLNIEKARIAKKSVTDKQLFFGKPEKAVKYIEQIQNQMSKQGTLVLLADSKIYGPNVRSISRKTHSQVIKNLGAEIEK